MTRSQTPGKTLALFWLGLLLVWLVGGALAQVADARCRPMSGRLPPSEPPDLPTEPRNPTPGAPTTPTPTDEPRTPTLGGRPAPTPTTPDTPNAPSKGEITGGSRRARPTAPDNSEWSWSTWWYFNRWSFLPSRNELLRAHFVRLQPITGGDGHVVDRWGKRRDTLARETAIPALMKMLKEDLRPSDEELKGTAALALARLTNDDVTVQAVLAVAEDRSLARAAREAAAVAAGLFRRTDPRHQMPGDRLDALRKRLLALAGSEKTPHEVRCMALLAVGVLADQPHGDGQPAGLAVTSLLWDRLQKIVSDTELSVATLTVLGLQPEGSVPAAVTEGLQAIALGKRFGGRRWNEWERSHAFTALVRLNAPSWRSLLFRVLGLKRGVSPFVRRAAFIALGARARDFTAKERLTALKAWEAGNRLARDPLTTGLAGIALGRLLAADLQAEDGRVLDVSRAPKSLLRGARTGPTSTRGFGVLALALAAREAKASGKRLAKWRGQAVDVVMTGLRLGRGDGTARGAYVVAAGLMGLNEAVPVLEKIIEDRNEERELRGFAAVACGQIGKSSPRTVTALKSALMDHRSDGLRREAALALAYLCGTTEAAALRWHMARSKTRHSHVLGHVALALGQMGDLGSVPALAEMAGDSDIRHGARGGSAVALGLICDPEARPSLARLWEDANYPARTATLHAVLNYF